MSAIKKVTIHLPKDLLKKAQDQLKMGITDTVKMGLKLVTAQQAYEDLVDLKGKVKFTKDAKKLRDDRE